MAPLSLRREPTVVIIEDAHWIDAASESMLADFMAVSPQVPSLMLITYRPEYRGALSRVPGAQTIALRPLSDRAHNGVDRPNWSAAIRHLPAWWNGSFAAPPETRSSQRRWCAIWPNAG